MKTFYYVVFALLTICVNADDIKMVSLPLIHDIQRADIYVLKLSDRPTGLLVLCPGCNGNGEEWVKNSIWQRFARDENLDLIGISFASDVSALKAGRGYYYARLGSGQLLLDGIKQVYPKELPLILYGFSGGAHFTSGFAEWRPQRVMAWCAYSAEWWDNPVPMRDCPPGLVACGEDDQRLGASLTYFKQGRALRKPWLWLCAAKTGHSILPAAEDFVRTYFADVLRNHGKVDSGEWVDINEKCEAEQSVLENQPTLTGWLPDPGLFVKWNEVHEP
jgi:hypothetical protein